MPRIWPCRRAKRRRAPAPAPRPGREGFTLVEILMVLAILSIGIIPLAVVQSNARRDVGRTDRYTQAMALAQSRVEQAKALGFNVAADDSGQAGQLRWISRVQNVSFGLDRIEVTVTWFDGHTDQVMRMASLISMR